LLLLIIFVMVGVAFLTVIQRKVLGYINICEGHNKVGFVGIFQPFRMGRQKSLERYEARNAWISFAVNFFTYGIQG
jgi:hypothetical protein